MAQDSWLTDRRQLRRSNRRPGPSCRSSSVSCHGRAPGARQLRGSLEGRGRVARRRAAVTARGRCLETGVTTVLDRVGHRTPAGPRGRSPGAGGRSAGRAGRRAAATDVQSRLVPQSVQRRRRPGLGVAQLSQPQSGRTRTAGRRRRGRARAGPAAGTDAAARCAGATRTAGGGVMAEPFRAGTGPGSQRSATARLRDGVRRVTATPPPAVARVRGPAARRPAGRG